MLSLNPLYQKSILAANSPSGGYSRLKRVFVASQNYKQYEKIVSGAKNKILGNIPKEILDIILKTYPENKVEYIKKMQFILGQTAKILKEYENEHLSFIQNQQEKDEERFLLHVFTNQNVKLLQSLGEKSVLVQATEYLKAKFNELFEGNYDITISHIGEGSFSNAFKLRIKDSNNTPLIEDRVMKVYKDGNVTAETKKEKFEYAKKLLAKYSDEDIFKILQKNKVFIPDEKTFFSKMEKHRRHYSRRSGAGEAKRRLNWLKKFSFVHGINAEANSYYRLKTILGHNIMRDGANAIDMFDLENGYSMAKCVNISTPKTKREVPFAKLGLMAQDLNPGNIVCGRLIDYGAIVNTDFRLLDKTVLKYYKKIVNRESVEEREKVLENYKNILQNPRTPLREKIKNAIDVYEDWVNMLN